MRPHSLISWKNDEGQDIAEYALIVAVIVLVTVAAIRLFWAALNRMGN